MSYTLAESIRRCTESQPGDVLNFLLKNLQGGRERQLRPTDLLPTIKEHTHARKDGLANTDTDGPTQRSINNVYEYLRTNVFKKDRKHKPEETKCCRAGCHIFNGHRRLQSNQRCLNIDNFSTGRK